MGANKYGRDIRRGRVMQLAIAGLSMRSIARQLKQEGLGDWTHQTVQNDLKYEVKVRGTTTPEMVAEHRELCMQRYNRLILSAWEPALQGDAKAASTVTNCLQGIRKMMGLDHPQQVEQTGSVTIVLNDADPANDGNTS